MPKGRAKGERMTITAPLVPVLEQLQERRLMVDLSETVNWVIRAYLEEHPELLPQTAPATTTTNKPQASASNDLESVLKGLS